MDNIAIIFDGLIENEKEFIFKSKYEFALYSDKNVKNQWNKEILYDFWL